MLAGPRFYAIYLVKKAYGNPDKAYANSVPGQYSLRPGGQHTLAFYTKCATPAGQHLLTLLNLSAATATIMLMNSFHQTSVTKNSIYMKRGTR